MPAVALESCVQLKLDYDFEGWEKVYGERLRFLVWLFGFEVVEERVYRSNGGGHHVRLWISSFIPLSPTELSLLQAILGSDPVREGFNLRRIRAGQRNWNQLHNTGKNYKRLR